LLQELQLKVRVLPSVRVVILLFLLITHVSKPAQMDIMARQLIIHVI
jgi:hypothetical protein